MAKSIITEGRKVRISHPDEYFFMNILAKYIRHTNIKASDFIIAVQAIELKVDKFYTLDKDQKAAYYNLKKFQ